MSLDASVVGCTGTCILGDDWIWNQWDRMVELKTETKY